SVGIAAGAGPADFSAGIGAIEQYGGLEGGGGEGRMKDQDLNKLLDSYTVRPPSAGLATRIVAQAANTPQGAVVVPFPRRSGQNAGLGNVWRPAAALIAASFVGFW